MNRAIVAALAALTATLSGPCVALAGSQDVVVEDAWARASIGTSRPGAAYLTIRNAGGETVALTGLATPAAASAEVHRTTIDERGVSSMIPTDEIVVGPGESVALEPGGLHAMLMGLKAPLSEGGSLTLTLTFSDGGEVTVAVPVLGIAVRGPEG